MSGKLKHWSEYYEKRPRIPLAQRRTLRSSAARPNSARRAGREGKRPGRQNGLAFRVKVVRSEGKPPVRDYFELTGAGGGGAISFFCAQAPRPSAPAATATIMIILTNFTINSPPSLAGCCGLFRRRNQCVQRNSRPFFYASITTSAPSGIWSKSAIKSAFFIRTHP